MATGYVRLYRKIRDCEALKERGKKLSRFEAWLDIVAFRANGIERKGMKRGEFSASLNELAKSWNWSRAAVERFLKDLQSTEDPMLGVLRHQARHQARHFIVCKYSTYNPIRDSERDTKRDTPVLDNSPSALFPSNNTGTDLAVKIKSKVRIKETTTTSSQPAGAGSADRPLPSIEAYQLSERLRKAILDRDPNSRAAKLPDTTRWAHDIDKLLRIDGRSVEDCEAVINWCQRDAFWGPNILSGRKLREKFDTLWGQMQRASKRDDRSRFANDQQTEFEPLTWSEAKWKLFEKIHGPEAAAELRARCEKIRRGES